MSIRKTAAFALAALTLALPLAGCRRSKPAEEEKEKPQILTNVFRGTVYPLPESYSVEDRGMVVWDAETGRVKCAASGYFEDVDEEGNYAYTAKTVFFTLDENGVVEEQEIESPGENGYIQTVCAAGDDIVYLWEQWNESDGSEKWFLTRIDGETGERTDSDEISRLFGDTGRDWFYVNYMCADGDGDIYLNSDQEVLVLNREFIRQFILKRAVGV